jgi:hypothetical protein
VVRGASWRFLFTIRDRSRNNAPVNLTDALVWFTVKNRVEDVAPVIAKRNLAAGGVDNQILVTLPQTGMALGQFVVIGDPADTAPLDPGETYVCDAFVQLPGGPPVERYQVQRNRGFVIEPAVTTTF